MDLVLVSSVINTSNKPLSYTPTRSVYSVQQRYEQTLDTIKSLEKIENKKILFVELSDIPEYENEIISKVDFYKNIYKENKDIVDGLHKGVGEALSILEGIKDIDLTLYDNIYKISGRYWLTDKFNYSLWNNNDTMLYEDKKHNSIVTVLYKINKNQYKEWISTLTNICYTSNPKAIEWIFKEHMKNYTPINPVGVSGYFSIDGKYFEI